MSRIVIKTGQAPPRAMPLPYEGVVRVGSSPACELTLHDADVRSRHCVLRCTGGKVGLIVTDPTAEVSVNGKRVRKRRLEEGDLICIGKSEVRVHIDGKDPFVGTSIAGYRIEERIGSGTTGTVYRAKQISLDRIVALKILSARCANDAAFVRAFLKEARAVARLSHPGVVQVHDAGQEDGKFYFSMEHLAGGTLGDRLRRDGAIPLDQALRYARDAAEALVWAEQRGIVHRDVKPGNLLLTADGTVKLGDLGIAVDLSSDAKQSRRAGSPAYMAPEQARAGPIDHRVDVYGLGSTLFHLLSGKLPFAFTSRAELIKTKMAEDPPLLETVLPDAPPVVSRLVQKMIARDPKRRFSTCREMFDAIEGALVEVTGRPMDTHLGPDRPAVGSSQQKRNTRAVSRVAIAIGVVIAIGAGIWGWLPDRPHAGDQESGDDDRTSVSASTGDRSDRAEGDAVSLRGTEVRQDRATRGNARDRVDLIEREKIPLAKEIIRPRKDDRQPSVPAADRGVDPGQLRVLEELGVIRGNWLAGVVESPTALQLLGEFQQRHPEPIYGESIARVLREIGNKVAAASKKLAQAELDTVVRPRIERSEFAWSMLHLAEMKNRFPEHAELIAGEVKKVDLASERLWTRTAATVDGKMHGSDFVGSRRSLAAVQKLLPPSFKERVIEKLAAVKAAQERYWEEAASLYGYELKIEDAISRADFEAARAVVSGSLTAGVASAKTVADWRSRIMKDIERCEAGWSRLEAGIERLVDKKRIVQLRRVSGSANKSVSVRLRELRSGMLWFRPTKGKKKESVEIFSLCDENLLDLTLEGLRAEGSTAEGESLEALGVLLVYRKGPLRAAGVLSDSRIAEARRVAYGKRLEIEAGHYLGRRVHALTVEKRRLGELTEKKRSSGDASEWEALVRRAGTTIMEYRKSAAYRRVRTPLAGTFLEARAHSLRRAAPGSLLHPARLAEKDSVVELSYRFQNEVELLDFRRVGPGSTIALGEVGLRLKGECRLLRGNPFRGKIVVKARVGADAYDRDSPNINLALWTHDGDQVSERSEATPAPGESAMPSDYAVFGIGYHVSSGTLSVYGRGGETVLMPADVFMGGQRGSRLGTFPASECISATSAARKRISQMVWISMTSKTLIWKVNDKKRSLTSRQLDRFNREEPRTGSVTLFTNGSTVEFSSLTVTGALDPEWIEAEVQAQAIDALRRIEPEYPFEE